jgi:hypothetical protein
MNWQKSGPDRPGLTFHPVRSGLFWFGWTGAELPDWFQLCFKQHNEIVKRSFISRQTTSS